MPSRFSSRKVEPYAVSLQIFEVISKESLRRGRSVIVLNLTPHEDAEFDIWKTNVCYGHVTVTVYPLLLSSSLRPDRVWGPPTGDLSPGVKRPKSPPFSV